MESTECHVRDLFAGIVASDSDRRWGVAATRPKRKNVGSCGRMLYLPRLLLDPPRDTHGVCGFGKNISITRAMSSTLPIKRLEENSLARLSAHPSAGETDEERLNSDLELMMIIAQ